MIKFVVAAIWLSSVTLGAVLWGARPPAGEGEDGKAEPVPALLGGLDFVKTEVIPVPVVRDETVQGYFLARLVYTVEPDKLARLSVPPETLIVDQVYTYLYGNPHIDFSDLGKFDTDGFRSGIRDSINKRVGETLVHDVMIDQIDFLSKTDIRDNAIRRHKQMATPGGGNKVASPSSHF